MPRIHTTATIDFCSGYGALLFDCDGTLADTMGLHYEAWRETVEPLGLVFPHARYTSMAGTPTRKILETLGREQGIAVDVDTLLPEKERRFVERMHAVKPIPAVVDLLAAAHGRVPVAVVSGGIRRAVVRTLEHTGLLRYFDVIVTAEDTERGKPHPDPFLAAARRLAVDAPRCLVFEDGDPGIEAGLAAGMDVVDVRPMIGG